MDGPDSLIKIITTTTGGQVQGPMIANTDTVHTNDTDTVVGNPTQNGDFEFVLMAPNGGLDKSGISQIRAHTTRELHKTRRQAGQVCSSILADRVPSIFPFPSLPFILLEIVPFSSIVIILQCG